MHHVERLLTDLQPGLLLRDLLIEAGDLPVIARGITDQYQRGVLPILLRGLNLPLGLLSGPRQLAPQIQFIAQIQRGTVRLRRGGIAAQVFFIACTAANRNVRCQVGIG
ncbi:hypothetical protein D3C77_562150 [compost metagenome]